MLGRGSLRSIPAPTPLQVLAAPPYVGIVMEYVSGGTLFDYVSSRGGLSEPEARWFFQQLLIGLDYCHKRGAQHKHRSTSLCLPVRVVVRSSLFVCVGRVHGGGRAGQWERGCGRWPRPPRPTPPRPPPPRAQA